MAQVQLVKQVRLNMNRLIANIVFLFAFLISNAAFAEDRINFVGASADVGAPDGLGVGLVVRPFPWVRLNSHFTHNTAAPGYRTGLTLDPIDFPIAPTATIECGTSVPGRIIGLEKSPFVWYNYANFHLGLELGRRNHLRFYFHGGASIIDVRTKAASYLLDNKEFVLVSDPSLSATVLPTFKMGFVKFF